MRVPTESDKDLAFVVGGTAAAGVVGTASWWGLVALLSAHPEDSPDGWVIAAGSFLMLLGIAAAVALLICGWELFSQAKRMIRG
jgi:hypothetical protein